jgi:hypothetical protein
MDCGLFWFTPTPSSTSWMKTMCVSCGCCTSDGTSDQSFRRGVRGKVDVLYGSDQCDFGRAERCASHSLTAARISSM